MFSSYQRSLGATSADIRRALRSAKDVAVELVRYTSQGKARYAALVLPKTGDARFVPLFTQDEIENYPIKGDARMHGTLKRNLGSYNRSYRQDKNEIFEDQALAQKIWNPILDAVPQGATVYFAPEGIFNILAIEYMDFGRKGYTLRRVSSTRSLLAEPRKELLGRTLIVGGVDYDDASEALQFEEPLPYRAGSRTLFEERKDVSPSIKLFDYLEGSKRESMHIAAILQGRDVTIDSVSHVPEERLKSEMGYYSTVVISTHGYAYFFGSDTPPHRQDSIVEDKSLLRSGIVLSGVNKSALPDDGNRFVEDGILTAQEFCDMDLSRVGLVVLSACQTGLGSTVDEGLVGIPLGLKKAGAGTVVVSLWPVDDQSTEQLMTRFFRHLSGGKCKSVAEAMERARQELGKVKEVTEEVTSRFDAGTMATKKTTRKKKVDFSKPYFMNAFVVIDGM